MASRSRCDSPAPRAATTIRAATGNHGVTQTEPTAVLKSRETQKSASPLSATVILAIALLLGRSALITDTKDPLGDVPTRTALVVFLALGAVVMRFDFNEFAKQEAKKEGMNLEPASTGWVWLLLVLLLSTTVAWNGMLAPRHSTTTIVVGPVTASKLWQPALMEELYLRAAKLKDVPAGRAAKLKDVPEDLKNMVCRDLDASLVQQNDAHTSMTETARRAAQKEVANIAELTSEKYISSTMSLRWCVCAKVADELVVVCVSLALALGLAIAVYDLVEMIQQAQEEDAPGTAVEYPEAEKIYKPSSSYSQWRLVACIAFLVAIIAGSVASVVEDR